MFHLFFFFFSSRRRHTRFDCDWSSVCSSDLIPIVPSAVIFDLGNAGKPLGWPSPDDAYRACDNAGADYPDGLVGVGRGATCGKAAGIEKMVPAGIGSWATRFGDVIVSALVVVNAVGDVRNARGELIAAGRGSDGKFVDSLQYLAAGGAPLGDPERLNRNTTLAVIATNADLDRVQLQALAQSGSDALARRITPYGSLYSIDRKSTRLNSSHSQISYAVFCL